MLTPSKPLAEALADFRDDLIGRFPEHRQMLAFLAETGRQAFEQALTNRQPLHPATLDQVCRKLDEMLPSVIELYEDEEGTPDDEVLIAVMQHRQTIRARLFKGQIEWGTVAHELREAPGTDYLSPEALEVARAEGAADTKRTAKNLFALGQAYENIGLIEAALEAYGSIEHLLPKEKETLSEESILRIQMRIIRILSSLALSYEQTGCFERAFAHLKKIFWRIRQFEKSDIPPEFREEILDIEKLMIKSLTAIGQFFETKGAFDQAWLAYFQSSGYDDNPDTNPQGVAGEDRCWKKKDAMKKLRISGQ